MIRSPPEAHLWIANVTLIDVDTLLLMEVDRLLHFVQRSEQPCRLSRFKGTSVLRTKLVILRWRQRCIAYRAGQGSAIGVRRSGTEIWNREDFD